MRADPPTSAADVAADRRAFLASGGRIVKVPRGLSGEEAATLKGEAHLRAYGRRKFRIREERALGRSRGP